MGDDLFAGAVAVRHGGAVGSLRILGGQALAEAVAQLADDRRGHEARVVRVGCGGVVGRVHCLRCGSCAVRVGGGGEDDHVPRGQAAHVERESRAALLIRARREVKGHRSATVVRADGEVDGSPGRCLGRDRRLLARFVRGFVRVGAGDVRRARGGGRCAARQGQSGGDDRGAQHDGGGDGQGMSCLRDVCVLEVVDGTARWGSILKIWVF